MFRHGRFVRFGWLVLMAGVRLWSKVLLGVARGWENLSVTSKNDSFKSAATMRNDESAVKPKGAKCCVRSVKKTHSGTVQ